MLKAVLFDLDDTLIDWSGFTANWEHAEAPHVRGVFDYICREVHPLEDADGFAKEYYKRTREAWMNARNTLLAPHVGRILIETAAALGAPAERLQIEACLAAFAWRAPADVSAFPDVFEILALLRDQGIKLGIVTNAYQPMLLRDVELEHHGLLGYFPDCRISAADVGYLKPHPQIFRAAMDLLDTTPEETVFVGDNPVADIAGAQAAGLRAVLRVKHPNQPLISGLVVPDGALNTLEELPGLLDEWYADWRA